MHAYFNCWYILHIDMRGWDLCHDVFTVPVQAPSRAQVFMTWQEHLLPTERFQSLNVEEVLLLISPGDDEQSSGSFR